LYSIDCGISSLGFTETPVFYIKNIIQILSPLINWIIFITLMKIFYFLKKNKFKSYVYVISALIYLFISLSELFKYIIESISCRKIEDIKYILADLNEICYSD
jgi:hypothetical protein